MSFIIGDRVYETSSAPGTGTFSLAGTATGFQTFVAGVGGGNKTYYTASQAGQWEIGIGTVTNAAPDRLSRDTVIASTNGGSKVNFTGTVNIVGTVPGQEFDKRTLLKNATYTIQEVDKGRMIEYTTSSAITWTLPSCSNVGSGFEISLANNGTGVLTISPNGFPAGDVIGTLTTGQRLAIYPGEAYTLRVNDAETGWTWLNRSLPYSLTNRAGGATNRPYATRYIDGDASESIAAAKFITTTTSLPTGTLQTSGSISSMDSNAPFDIYGSGTAGSWIFKNTSGQNCRWRRSTNGGAMTTGTLSNGGTVTMAAVGTTDHEYIFARSNNGYIISIEGMMYSNSLQYTARWN